MLEILFCCIKHPHGCFVGLGFYQAHSLCEPIALAIVGLVEERTRNQVESIRYKGKSVARFGTIKLSRF